MQQTNKGKFGLFDSAMLIMGSMIGSGIFIVSAGMARSLETAGMLLLAWILTMLITMSASLCYGELAAAMPKAGGQYIYLREAYGKLTGFLYGWTLFTVIQSGTIAAVAVAFAKFSGVFFPFLNDSPYLGPISTQQIVAVCVIWILSFFNFGNLKNSAILQNTFTITKIGALILIILAGIYAILKGNFTHKIDWTLFPHGFSVETVSLLAVAMVGSLFSADAWNNITFTAGEIKKPEKNLPLALVIGTGTVLSIYVLVNFLYIQVLSLPEIQNAPFDRVGTVFLEKLSGNVGLQLMAGLIMVSTFGCLNGIILSSARVYFAMASDRLFFPPAKRLNSKGAPANALIAQGVWSSLLALSGSYGDLLDYVVFAVLLFYILTIGGIFILRKKQPEMPRPYRALGYPILPLVYILLASFVCLALLIYKPEYTWPGLAIVSLGIPVYYILNRFLRSKE